MKVTPELKRLLEEAAGEVAEVALSGNRSLDPIGDEGRENVQRAPAGKLGCLARRSRPCIIDCEGLPRTVAGARDAMSKLQVKST